MDFLTHFTKIYTFIYITVIVLKLRCSLFFQNFWVDTSLKTLCLTLKKKKKKKKKKLEEYICSCICRCKGIRNVKMIIFNTQITQGFQ